MRWQELLATDSASWRGIEAYAITRIDELTKICAAIESTDKEIRQAQSGILELQRLMSLPQMIQTEKQSRGQLGARREY